jgi:hypothetical protein
MKSKTPEENFPAIGTVDNPALLFDGADLLLSYSIAPIAGGGVLILRFSDVIHFETNPINVEGMKDAKYPMKAWDFMEVWDCDRTIEWKILSARFWTISFNDVTVEVVFGDVEIVRETKQVTKPIEELVMYMNTV